MLDFYFKYYGKSLLCFGQIEFMFSKDHSDCQGDSELQENRWKKGNQ